MRTEKIVLNEEKNVTLTAYIQDVGGEFANIVKRPAVLVLPGGGYQNCSDREADPVAVAYLQAGYQAFILRYSVGENAKWPAPLEDYERAMSLIQSKEEEWSLYPDKVAVIGFSAGGHLAAAAATIAKNRPAAILGYALTGEDVKAYSADAPDLIPYVDYDTCPCFLFAARTDELVPVMNSIKFMEALADAKVAFESHIYAYGPHGFSVCDSSVGQKSSGFCRRIPNWVGDSVEWQKEVLGDFGNGCMTEPLCKVHINGDKEPSLSIDCTIGHLMSHPEGSRVIGELFNDVLKSGNQNAVPQEMPSVLSNILLRTVLGFMDMSQEDMEALNQRLMWISNL